MVSNSEGRKHHPFVYSWNSQVTGVIQGAGSLMGGQITRTGKIKATGPWLHEYCGRPGNIIEAFRSEIGEAKLPASCSDWLGQSEPLNTLMIESAVRS